MDTIDKILQLMDSTGITAAKLTQEAGITNGLISQWKNRKQEPSTKNLKKIATYFNVSIDWLSGNEQKNKPAVENDELNKLLKDPEMEEIYEILNRLSSDGVQKVLEYAHFQREQEKQQNL